MVGLDSSSRTTSALGVVDGIIISVDSVQKTALDEQHFIVRKQLLLVLLQIMFWFAEQILLSLMTDDSKWHGLQEPGYPMQCGHEDMLSIERFAVFAQRYLGFQLECFHAGLQCTSISYSR